MNSGAVQPERQRGVVLLSLFVLLFLAGAGVLISVLDNNAVAQRRNTDTVLALNEAKQALIAYAVLYSDYNAGAGPGYLPCPDSNGNGAENVNCGLDSLGRLPELITPPLGPDFHLSDFNNNIDEQFWYSVSNSFRRGALGILNTSTVSTLTLDARNRLAAVIIAPGPATGAQNRPSNASDRYLEAGNTTAPGFVSADAVSPELFNDRLVAITIDEIMMPVTRKVADVLQAQLDAYHVLLLRYPTALEYAAWLPLAALPAWFTANGWDVVTQYVRDTPNQATLTFVGCPNISYQLSYVVNDSPASIRKIGAQC